MRFVSSLAALVVVVVALPYGLITAARARFGGGSPWAGVPSPDTWEWARVRRALTEQLTDDTIADVLVRTSLVVAWVAAGVFVVTVLAEATHMVRHGGLPLPAVRGLGVAQSAARLVAAGLLVVLPVVTSTSRVEARPALVSEHARVELDVGGTPAPEPYVTEPSRAEPLAGSFGDERRDPAAGAGYVVRAGDSVYAIAERIAGPDPAAIQEFAEQLLDLNLGRVMPDGQRFDNAAFVDVGWVLDLPPAAPSSAHPVAPDEGHVVEHVVERGETLWSIADDELGDPERWPEIFDANRGRTFDDGRVLDDPSLIQPGWDLDLPGAATSDVTSEAPTDPVPVDATPDDPEPEEPEEPVDPQPVDPEPVEIDMGAAHGEDPARSDGGDPEAAHESVGPINRWLEIAPSEPDSAAGMAPPTADPRSSAATDRPSAELGESGVELLTLGRAAMLSAGALTLLGVRRHARLRRSRPRTRLPEPSPGAVRTERVLRSLAPGDRLLRVDVAVRAAASSLVAGGRRVHAVLIGDDGDIELVATGRVGLDAPWEATDSPSRWRLPADVPVEHLAGAARQVGAPCPTLVQLGRTIDDRELYVDLEAIEALEVGGPGDQADAIVTAVAATLAGSVLAEVTTLVGVGVDDDAFLGHRHHVPAHDIANGLGRA
ncbi:MAG: LysM peptidoglycan-binding domain-containing protein, partial [Acidimicrobiia bacterium]